jgi:ABC-type phosphate/phosphonate transport system permease subunit
VNSLRIVGEVAWAALFAAFAHFCGITLDIVKHNWREARAELTELRRRKLEAQERGFREYRHQQAGKMVREWQERRRG